MSKGKLLGEIKLEIPPISIEIDPEWVNLLITVVAESDRGAVLACGGYIEKFVRETFLDGERRFSFSQQILVLRSMFLQKELTDMLEIIRTIRNKAAHCHKPFKLNDFGQRFNNSLVAKAKKFDLYTKIRDTKIVFNVDRTQIKALEIALGKTVETIGELVDALAKDRKMIDRLNFCMVCLMILGYCEAVHSAPFAKLRNVIPKFN